MSKTIIDKKIKTTDEFAKKIKEAKSILVFEYLGLTVKELTAMRQKLHADGVSISIVKNNILNRAFAANKVEGIEECVGPNAIIISNGDEIISFKAIADLMKTKEFVKFKFGILENKIITADKLNSVASLPGRNGLYSMFLSCLTAPIRNFLYGLKAVAETKQN